MSSETDIEQEGDLAPVFWAVVVIVVLFVINQFQLGPHTFSGGTKEKTGARRKGGGRKKARPIPITQKPFYTFLKATFGGPMFEDKFAIIYINEGGGTVLRPHPPGTKLISQCLSPAPYPEEQELDNYVVAFGEDNSDETVLERFETLWRAKNRSVCEIIMYTALIPSAYATQELVNILGEHANEVSVSVLYSHDDDYEGSRGEKVEHMERAGINFEKVN